jgi:two-component system, sensor histidine kinase
MTVSEAKLGIDAAARCIGGSCMILNQVVVPVLVLVVDDCEVNGRITTKLMSALGFDVHRARNGLQAVMACAQRAYTFILMDFQMPVMDGLEATAAIRAAEKHRGTRTPIIGYSSCAHGPTLLAAGMDDYLDKPASPAALRAKINLWCNACAA